MAEFIRRRERVTIEKYCYGFIYAGNDPAFRGCGSAFPCDKDGNILFDQLEYAARLNLMDSIIKVERGEYEEEGVLDYSNSYWEPAVIKCGACQQPCTLDSSWENECACGALYNGSGQRLAPREQWGWETGETYADIVSGNPLEPDEDRYYNL